MTKAERPCWRPAIRRVEDDPETAQMHARQLRERGRVRARAVRKKIRVDRADAWVSVVVSHTLVGEHTWEKHGSTSGLAHADGPWRMEECATCKARRMVLR